MEYDSNVITGFALVGMGTGILLLLAGIVIYFLPARQSSEGERSPWVIFGGLSVPGAWIASFPLSNRDSPLTWFLLEMFMWGAGLGIGLIVAAVTARRRG